MKLNVTYDANTLATAPSDFYGAVNYVAGLFGSTRAYPVDTYDHNG